MDLKRFKAMGKLHMTVEEARQMFIYVANKMVGQQQQTAGHQLPVNQHQDHEAADELNHRPPGVVQHAEHQITDTTGVLPQDAGCATRLQFLNAMQEEVFRVAVLRRFQYHATDLTRESLKKFSVAVGAHQARQMVAGRPERGEPV